MSIDIADDTFDPTTVTTLAMVRALSPEHRRIWEDLRYTLANIPADKREGLRVYDNGAIARAEGGIAPIVANPSGGMAAITPANSADLRAQLWAGKIEAKMAARQGIQLASSSESESAGWRHIVTKQATLAADTARGRVSTEAAKFVGAAADYLGADHDQQAPGSARLTLDIPGEALAALAQALAGRSNTSKDDVIDGEYSDV